MDEEPSVLDYLKQKLSFRKNPSQEEIKIPLDEDSSQKKALAGISGQVALSLRGFPKFSLIALVLALFAQTRLEPLVQSGTTGIVLYIAAAFFLILALLRKELVMSPAQSVASNVVGTNVRTVPLFFFVALVIVSFLSFKDNRFTLTNVTVWIVTLVMGLVSFWEMKKPITPKAIREKIGDFIRHGVLDLKLDGWKLLVVAVFVISAIFHLYQLNAIPINMTSDHTEKLLDVNGILNGTPQIFFANNGGREPIHFYLAALFIKLFNTGVNFLTLKLTMTVAFLFSLIYGYRLGKEVSNRWTGLFFIALLGISSWANMITRVGLRLILAPAFIAPVLFYLLRGLRTLQRNDFILAGIFTGLGLLGYSAFRVMPLVILLGIIIFTAYQKFNRSSRSTWWGLVVLALFALVMALPIIRFAIQYPEAIGFRTLTRMTSAEHQIHGGVFGVFLSNLWNALTMTFWKDGNTWVISIPNRPALDVVSAALYFIGLVLMGFRWLRSKRWQDLFLLVSIPILMLPSILSLAFPEENPSLSRAGGALIPIFLICAIALETLLNGLWARSKRVSGRVCVVLLGLGLMGISASQNWDIALRQYPQQYKNATWNSMQMGQVAQEFIQLTGEPENVWVVGVPYWVDTRLVALSAGFVGKDYAVWPQDIAVNTIGNTGAKLFIVKFDDETGMRTLRSVYPTGFAVLHPSDTEGRDFYTYIVPPQDGN